MNRWADWLYDYRLGATIVVTLLTVFFAWEVKHLEISTHFSDLLPRNHPYVKIFEKYHLWFSFYSVPRHRSQERNDLQPAHAAKNSGGNETSRLDPRR